MGDETSSTRWHGPNLARVQSGLNGMEEMRERETLTDHLGTESPGTPTLAIISETCSLPST